jgi:membrane protein YqaA with SNARE-associated domain
LLVSIASTVTRRSASRKFFVWVYHLGGLGLIPLGIIDNSIIPITGSMDVVTVLLCAQGKDWWPYYSFMAIVGSVLGGYITYRLARGESKGRLSKILSRSKIKGFKELFKKWGFSAIVIPAILPPPFPIVPFLIAAGATQYPRGKFIAALTIGRSVRYLILGLLGFLYGHWILRLMRDHVYLIAAVGGGIIALSVALALFRLRHDTAKAS